MNKRIVAATGNEGKIREIREILAELNCEIISMKQAGIDVNIVENGLTFEENAFIKAKAVHGFCGDMVIADDSGLEIDFLDSMPGVFSARFAGAGSSDYEKNMKILSLMSGIPEKYRTAHFVCSIVFMKKGSAALSIRGICTGKIALRPAGNNGFGYDPIFYLPEYEKTMAQLSIDQKNRISHRAKALKILKEELKKIL